MWSVFARIFTRNSSNSDGIGVESGGEPRTCTAAMDHRTTADNRQHTRQDSSAEPLDNESKKAKQKAIVKWLLSKAFNNQVPSNLREPFYRDHENQEHLKPQIVGALANADMYCQALGNIYSDPNYHNLNHSSILQMLARKGVFVAEPNDSHMTETTLIQTNPLRMSAHMAVIESMMALYAKEVVTPDRVAAAVQRFGGRERTGQVPEHHEQGLIYWVNAANEALMRRIEEDMAAGRVSNGGSEKRKVEIARVRELRDLGDGVALAGLISYYCPERLPWEEMKISKMPAVAECLYNLGLVQEFCQRDLPANVFHMMPEDITYMRGSMKQNLIVFLADLFNLLEIHPVECVRYPGMEKMSSEGFPARNAHGVAHKRNLPPTIMTPIPDLRSGLDDHPTVAPQPFQVLRTPTHQPLRKANSLQQSMSEMSEDSLRRGSEDSFVVHRGKNIPTLSSMIHDEPSAPVRMRSNKEKLNADTKAEERGDSKAAGKPSNWNENKRTFAGRRSRRNSTSDDSQLTIENFGGSQDNINFIGKNPDKEVGAHVGRKISAPCAPVERIENPAVRSTLQDARGSIQLGYDNGCEKHETERENYKLKRQLSTDEMTLRSLMQDRNKENVVQDVIDGEANSRMSFADVNKRDPGGIQLVYMQQESEKGGFPSKSSFKSNGTSAGMSEKKTTTFATLPNTTTWQQQSSQHQAESSRSETESSVRSSDHVVASQLSDIRMQLEEKRRHIESEKRKVEMELSKQRQKVGNAAFLQAVVKGKGGLVKSSSDAMVDSLMAGPGGAGAGGSVPSSPTDAAGPSVAPKQPAVRPQTVKEKPEELSIDRKWMDDGQPLVETRRTPDLDNMNLETYQQSITEMNSSLQDIQAEMQRLASKQNQIQLAQFYAQQQKMMQQQQQTFAHHLPYNQGPIYNPLQSSASAPHIPQSLYQQPQRLHAEPQFFLHGQESPVPQPVAPQRRTWSQHAQMTPPMVVPGSNESYQQMQQSPQPQAHPEMRTWGKPQNPAAFMLHDDSSDRYDRYQDNRYHNGSGDHSMNHSNSTGAVGFTLSQQHQQHQQQLFSSHHSTPSTSPQHNRQHRQISQLMEMKRASPVSLQSMEPIRPERKTNVIHAPIPAPPVDDMEPQSISFIGKPDEQISEGVSRLHMTSGSRTYRIPSPTRPLITRNSFQPLPAAHLERERIAATPSPDIASSSDDAVNQKGFYISFDNEAPKRPKPPLRTKKGTASPKKERSYVEDDETERERERAQQRRLLEKELEQERMKKEMEDRRRNVESERQKREATSQEMEKVNAASAIIIGNELSNPDPDLIDERERKKKRILQSSLQRRQQLEEAKAMKEAEAQARRERMMAKEEEKMRKKEEQMARRQAILEQHKLKKAIEEAEREGKDVDKSLLNSLRTVPKLRAKGSTSRPRPKTIHIDSGSVEMAEGMLQPSRGKKGSNSNLTANSYASSTMKRDYYRGSQDSLASSGLLYKDSPDDSRGMSPCHSANQTLGRRSSYKTSRDPSPAQTRGRPKYSTYQNFKGRKSNSMMNLYGSSTDQDSLAYRFGDTDSGLGRATPPRRAPSPGMGPIRHLTSPSSGPGSLPVSKRRGVFDDGSSDISSTPSSIMDYTGPRLYKQPATKSNRSIMHNAVEYCVFPGAVNRESKQRVLDCISKSESKHFLLLFRDAGCQFRALYSYCPDDEKIEKLYGTGPKVVNDTMFDRFFKYNSGGKCFAQVHTKHLTVTIDAFTIHNNLWQGKKVNMPNKKDMALVI